MPRARRRSPRDWGNVSKVVAEAYFPHELRLVGGDHEPRMTLRTLDLGPVMIGQVGWGADVSVECDYPGAYEINLPMTGHLESSGQHGPITSVAGQATVFRADSPSMISHWDATCIVLGVKFDRTWLEVEAERLLGTDHKLLRTLLPEQIGLDAGAGRAWRQLVSGLATHLHDPDVFADSTLVRDQLAGAVAAGLVETCDPDTGGAPARPHTVGRVLDEIHDDPARAWTASDMAVLAGTSVRRMQEGFRQWVGCSPTHYLQDVRLQRAHSDLLSDRSRTVSDVAAGWGFSSASRFAAAYKRRYGESPSQARR